MTITLDEAQGRLRDLISGLAPGQELIITDNHQTVAKLVGQAEIPRGPRPAPGLGRGEILFMADDFNDSMDDFFEIPG